ncbi:MAG: caspase family protein [Rhodanobacteraceae bacterium]|nr:caspase family protein [Rhodanobacteraceae bacterium]
MPRAPESVAIRPPRGWRRLALTLGSALAVSLLGSGPLLAKKTELPQGAISVDELYVVDCLLPGQVRQLGGNFTYLSARRPIRTTAKDCAIRGGEYVAYDRANYATALKVWLPAAKEGDANAMNYVGEIYEQGLGVEPDYATAAEWFRQAADKGHSSAMINLGSLYESGKGVQQDMTQAMNWYRKASGLSTGTLELVTEEEQAKRRAAAEETERLRGEVERLRSQLDNTRAQLGQQKAELDKSREALYGARAELAAAKSDQGKAAAAQQRIAELEKKIADQELAVDASRAESDKVLALMGVDMTQRGPAPAGTQPKIQLIAPKLVATRAGVLAAPLLAAVPSYQVVGRVYPAQSLKALKVNDRDFKDKVDADGLFQIDLDLAAGDTPVEIQAITNDGMSSVESFLITRDRGGAAAAKRVTSKLFQRRMRDDLGTFHALVIGNDAYTAFPALKTAVADADAVADQLQSRFGYKVSKLTNVGKEAIVAKLAELTMGMKKTDNLLIYYAGHGQIDAEGKGYWIPVDGGADNPASWISNDQVNDFLGASAAKHVMVVADSCYSGTMSGNAIRPIPLDAKEEDLLFISRVKARTVITSGGLQPVLDDGGSGHSIFAHAFLTALKQADGLAEGYRLYEEVSELVGQRSAIARLPQRPQYSALRHAGHEGSEFFFLPREA